jgi:multidrug efflux pump subunit AcrB
MVTVPLAIAGALISLHIYGQTLNIFSEIGMIMLIGLVTKNGILIVEFANQKQLLGQNKNAAVLDASVARFRPILMTSLAMSLGALPLALSLGDASTSRIPLGIVIVGGMLQMSGPLSSPVVILGAIAICVATINIAGGFYVTQRMLNKFHK